MTGKETAPRGIEHESSEFLSVGGIVREADPSKDIGFVRNLYVSPEVIEHLAGITPKDTGEKIKKYYLEHPNYRLLIAELPRGGAVGTLTISPEEGLRSVKFGRVAVQNDFRKKGVARELLKSGLSLAFSSLEEGGMGCEQVLLAVIQDVNGYEFAEKAFQKAGFNYLGPRFFSRCDGWDNERGAEVPRDVQMMFIQKRGVN